MRIRCHHSFAGEGHMIHVASLRAEEVIWRQEGDALPDRLWVAGKGQPFPPAGMGVVREQTFAGDSGDGYTLLLVQRDAAP